LQQRLEKEQVVVDVSQIVPIVDCGGGIFTGRAVSVHIAFRLRQAFGNLVDHLLKSFRSERRAWVRPVERAGGAVGQWRKQDRRWGERSPKRRELGNLRMKHYSSPFKSCPSPSYSP